MAPKFEQVNNPSLREEPRYQPARVIPVAQESSLLNWLEASGRLSARETAEDEYPTDEPDISALMDVSDAAYEDEEPEEEEMLD